MLLLAHAMPVWNFVMLRQWKQTGACARCPAARMFLAFSLKAFFDHYAIGPVAQWIRHRPTEPGIAGSSPAGVNDLVDTSIVTMPKLRILGGGKWALGGGHKMLQRQSSIHEQDHWSEGLRAAERAQIVGRDVP
jgi:hypothetical protein